MKKSFKLILVLALLSVALSYGLNSCKKQDNPNDLHYINQEKPEIFPEPLYHFADNPLSEEGIALGRKLFYDGRLSLDGNYPCASCHQQSAAFGTFEHDRSHGYNGSHTLRNAPPLYNLAWRSSFHWDGEFADFRSEAAQPINSHNEMAESFNGVIDKLQKDPEYRNMFRKVFRTEFISADNMLKALAQFTGTMVSANSKYDRFKKGEATLNTQETEGYELFTQHCAGCHPEPMFTDNSFRNTGLPLDPVLDDHGRIRVTGDAGDEGKFRVPSLRSVYLTSNYMHDGRFNTLLQCVNHYRTGIQAGPNVDPALVAGISLTDAQAVNITLFLRTLSDSSFLTDTRFTRP
ncbi:MAG: c-type cytochrome [Chitinophagaceae bacterium]|nr:MAG: c-type cytochrome [Chitinophagaceae bacterium]